MYRCMITTIFAVRRLRWKTAMCRLSKSWGGAGLSWRANKLADGGHERLFACMYGVIHFFFCCVQARKLRFRYVCGEIHQTWHSNHTFFFACRGLSGRKCGCCKEETHVTYTNGNEMSAFFFFFFAFSPCSGQCLPLYVTGRPSFCWL